MKKLINEGLRVRMASAGLTGSEYLELDNLDPATYPPAAISRTPDHPYLPSVPSTGTRMMQRVENVLGSVEKLRFDVPTPSAEAVSARLLDRTGNAVPIPIAASVRDDADGSRWRTARLALAPLAPGDYIIELASGPERTLFAFRVVP